MVSAGSASRSPGSAPVLDPPAVRALTAPLYAERQLRTGESFVEHADGMAAIIGALRPDADLLAAAYLFGVHDVLRDADDWLRGRLGEGVAQLVGDLRQLMKLSERTRARSPAAEADGQAEALRKMLLAMCNDLRVVLLRLASRVQTLRWMAAHETAGASSDATARTAIARETLELYAPLANRLGVWQLKWELEDLSFRLLEPAQYAQVAGWLEGLRADRAASIEAAMAELRIRLAAAGLTAEVSGRPKHLYSIWQKMQRKALAFDALYDVRAVRVIVPELAQCYQALSVVHERFAPVTSEYDDYIARPKPNGYQSLHTVVLADDGAPIEVQIRTRQMHASAELGVAAHWSYKEGGRADKDAAADRERVAWLRQLLAWRDDVEPPDNGPVQGSRIYVLTPQARVVELPAGSTPIDFAYHLHTELGHRCRGARVNGAMVPLNTALATGQTVEIVAAKTGGPSRDWLNADLGFLASARSRAKARQWFNAQEVEQSVAHGRDLVDRELARLGKTAVKLDDLAHRLGFASVDELCVAATKEEFSLRSIEHALVAPATQTAAPVSEVQLSKPRGSGAGSHVLVVGIDELMTSLARCCRPMPPDEIVGFVTRGKGVSIHRARCANAAALARRQPERLIEVAWGAAPDALYPVEVFVLAQDRQGLLRDVSEVFAREKLNVIGVNTLSHRHEAQMSFTLEVADAAALRRALSEVAEVRGVLAARRR
jgi:GTP pyrophosphokinase